MSEHKLTKEILQENIIDLVEIAFKHLANNIADSLVVMELNDADNTVYNDQLADKLDELLYKHYHEIIDEIKQYITTVA